MSFFLFNRLKSFSILKYSQYFFLYLYFFLKYFKNLRITIFAQITLCIIPSMYRLNKDTVKEFEIITKQLGTTYNLTLFEMIKFYKKHNLKK
jgi:hypothetical protein